MCICSFSLLCIVFIHPDYVCLIVLDYAHCLILLVSVTSHHRKTLYKSIIVARLGSSLEVDQVDELYILVVSV